MKMSELIYIKKSLRFSLSFWSHCNWSLNRTACPFILCQGFSRSLFFFHGNQICVTDFDLILLCFINLITLYISSYQQLKRSFFFYIIKFYKEVKMGFQCFISFFCKILLKIRFMCFKYWLNISSINNITSIAMFMSSFRRFSSEIKKMSELK